MRVTTPQEKKTLVDFFATLIEVNIFVVPLRNYSDIPEQIGHDLDIFCERKDKLRIVRILKMVASENNLKLLHTHEREYFLGLFFKSADSSEILHIDIYYGALTWHGLSFIEKKDFINRCQTTPVVRPSGEDEALTLLLISLIWGGFFKERYRGIICDFCKKEITRENLLKNMALILSKEDSNKLLELILSNEPIDGSYWAKKIRNGTRKLNYLNRPILSILKQFNYWAFEFKTVIFPMGKVVSMSLDFQESELSWSRELFGKIKIQKISELAQLGIFSFFRKILIFRKFLAQNYLLILLADVNELNFLRKGVISFFLKKRAFEILTPLEFQVSLLEK